MIRGYRVEFPGPEEALLQRGLVTRPSCCDVLGEAGMRRPAVSPPNCRTNRVIQFDFPIRFHIIRHLLYQFARKYEILSRGFGFKVLPSSRHLTRLFVSA